jgi:formate dehydrogenase subunit delta
LSPEKLTFMANQIGKFFAHQGEEKASASVAEHLRLFWDPRMRAGILAHLAAGGQGLDPAVRRAVEMLEEKQAAH